MGIYDNELYATSEFNIQEAQGYDNDYYSAQNIMIENTQNNLALFEGIIRSDIQELAMRQSGYVEEEVSVFTENVFTDLLGKIKSLFLKLWAKIKAIFKGFMARIDSVFMKSNKSFVNKYKSVILKKDMTDFEVKWRKPKGNNNYSLDLGSFDPKNDIKPEEKLSTMYWMGSDPHKQLEQWDEDKHMEEVLNHTHANLKVDSPSSYEKDFMNEVFDDEEVDDKIDIDNVMTALITMKDVKKENKRVNDSLNKALARMVKMIDKDHNDYIKQNPLKFDDKGKYEGEDVYHRTYSFKNSSGEYEANGQNISQGLSGASYDPTEDLKTGKDAKAVFKKGDTYNKDSMEYYHSYTPKLNNTVKSLELTDDRKTVADKYNKAFQLVHKWAIIYQTCATKYTAVVMKCFKFHNSQLRRVFAKAVAYNRKKDESVMMEAMADLADYYEDVIEY